MPILCNTLFMLDTLCATVPSVQVMFLSLCLSCLSMCWAIVQGISILYDSLLIALSNCNKKGGETIPPYTGRVVLSFLSHMLVLAPAIPWHRDQHIMWNKDRMNFGLEKGERFEEMIMHGHSEHRKEFNQQNSLPVSLTIFFSFFFVCASRSQQNSQDHQWKELAFSFSSASNK